METVKKQHKFKTCTLIAFIKKLIIVQIKSDLKFSVFFKAEEFDISESPIMPFSMHACVLSCD